MIPSEVCATIERETGQQVTANTPLGDLDMDSLEFLQLLMMLGEEFSVEIPAERAARCRTVGDLAAQF